ncbi:MAG: orotidine-5'-phosphate decarboxylase [Pseudomonadota bacterium]
MNSRLTARDRLIVALDTPSVDEARLIVKRLEGSVTFYKIGLELAMKGGIDLAQELIAAGSRVFLDMKFLDIENTVERAVASLAGCGISFLTVHGMDSKTLRAAAKGASASDLKILAVTVLTNLSESDLAEQGIKSDCIAELVIHRARLAQRAGCHGIVCSGHEAAAVRAATSPDFLIVTPGIRLDDDKVGDQVRVATPQTASRNGASHIVVGRPITQSEDIKAAAEKFLEIIARN